MSKITAEHLARSAIVYIRQSTADQLVHNKESQRRQYGLADRARQLGWVSVEVIDDDLGRSGGGISRPGFERLLAAICEGRVGAVLAIEASRLARNGRDWHTLIEFCGLVGTILVDEDGIYDPRHPNDRLLLGMKGTMSELELSYLFALQQASFNQLLDGVVTDAAYSRSLAQTHSLRIVQSSFLTGNRMITPGCRYTGLIPPLPFARGMAASVQHGGNLVVVVSNSHTTNDLQRLRGRGRFPYGTWSFHRELRMRTSLPVNHQLKIFSILVSAHNDLLDGGAEDHLLRAVSVRVESGRIPKELSMRESDSIDSLWGAQCRSRIRWTCVNE
jgi:hypothetical protein